MDFIAGLSEVRGCDSVYVAADRLSTYGYFTPYSSCITASFSNSRPEARWIPYKHYYGQGSQLRELVLAIIHGTLKDRPQHDHRELCRGRRPDGVHQPHPHTILAALHARKPFYWLAFLPCAEWVYNTAAVPRFPLQGMPRCRAQRHKLPLAAARLLTEARLYLQAVRR